MLKNYNKMLHWLIPHSINIKIKAILLNLSFVKHSSYKTKTIIFFFKLVQRNRNRIKHTHSRLKYLALAKSLSLSPSWLGQLIILPLWPEWVCLTLRPALSEDGNLSHTPWLSSHRAENLKWQIWTIYLKTK